MTISTLMGLVFIVIIEAEPPLDISSESAVAVPTCVHGHRGIPYLFHGELDYE